MTRLLVACFVLCLSLSGASAAMFGISPGMPLSELPSAKPMGMSGLTWVVEVPDPVPGLDRYEAMASRGEAVCAIAGSAYVSGKDAHATVDLLIAQMTEEFGEPTALHETFWEFPPNEDYEEISLSASDDWIIVTLSVHNTLKCIR